MRIEIFSAVMAFVGLALASVPEACQSSASMVATEYCRGNLDCLCEASTGQVERFDALGCPSDILHVQEARQQRDIYCLLVEPEECKEIPEKTCMQECFCATSPYSRCGPDADFKCWCHDTMFALLFAQCTRDKCNTDPNEGPGSGPMLCPDPRPGPPPLPAGEEQQQQ